MDLSIKLTTPCDHVKWLKLGMETEQEMGICPICKGTGEIPTKAGDELLEFLRKHQR